MLPSHMTERCHAYVTCQMKEHTRGPLNNGALPFLTISRQCGAGGRTLASEVMKRLDRAMPLERCKWAVFDKKLVQTAMKEHGLPDSLAEFLPEKNVSETESILGELFGLHPPLWELNKQVFETILHLARSGGAILVGRGSNFITSRLKNGFHVRLVGSETICLHRIMHYYQMEPDQARLYLKRENTARADWVKKNLGADVHAPENYHLVINTDHFPTEEAADLIVSSMRVLSRELLSTS